MGISFKCTEVAKTSIPFELKEAYTRLAHEAGCDLAELLRDQMCVAVHGVTWGVYVSNHRLAVISSKDPVQAQLGTNE